MPNTTQSLFNNSDYPSASKIQKIILELIAQLGISVEDITYNNLYVLYGLDFAYSLNSVDRKEDGTCGGWGLPNEDDSNFYVFVSSNSVELVLIHELIHFLQTPKQGAGVNIFREGSANLLDGYFADVYPKPLEDAKRFFWSNYAMINEPITEFIKKSFRVNPEDSGLDKNGKWTTWLGVVLCEEILRTYGLKHFWKVLYQMSVGATLELFFEGKVPLVDTDLYFSDVINLLKQRLKDSYKIDPPQGGYQIVSKSTNKHEPIF